MTEETETKTETETEIRNARKQLAEQQKVEFFKDAWNVAGITRPLKDITDDKITHSHIIDIGTDPGFAFILASLRPRTLITTNHGDYPLIRSLGDLTTAMYPEIYYISLDIDVRYHDLLQKAANNYLPPLSDKTPRVVTFNRVLHHIRGGKCNVHENKKDCGYEENPCIRPFLADVVEKIIDIAGRAIIQERYDPEREYTDGDGGQYLDDNEWNDLFHILKEKGYTTRLYKPVETVIITSDCPSTTEYLSDHVVLPTDIVTFSVYKQR